MTHKEELIAGLQKLMKSDGIKRSKMGLVFEIYDTLVELRNSGVKAGDIEVLLNDPEGVFNFKLPKGSLTSYMHRIKLKKAASRIERRVAVAAVEPAAPQKPGKPKAPAAPVESVESDGEKQNTVNTESETSQTQEDRRKDESKKLAEKYSGKLDDENGIGKYL